MEYRPTNPIVDVLDDPNRQTDPFFAKAKVCLPIAKPKSILRVRHQKSSNSCCAFGATATVYGAQIRHKGCAVPGSAQELLDYTSLYKRPKIAQSSGPYKVPKEGHVFSYKTAFNYIREHGITPEEDYKFVGTCKFEETDGKPWDGKVICDKGLVQREKKIFISGYKHIARDDIRKVLLEQPITGIVGLTVEFLGWKDQRIYNVSPLQNALRHAVTIVGYGCEDDIDYFLCQNSYGLEWGYKGYIKVAEKLVTHTYIPLISGEGISSPSLNDDVACGQSHGKRKREDKDVDEL